MTTKERNEIQLKEYFEILSELPDLDEQIIRANYDKVNWTSIALCNKVISKEFIREFKDYIHFSDLFEYGGEEQFCKRYDIDFIREFIPRYNKQIDNKDWNNLSMLKLKEKDIEEFKDKVNWSKISYYQKFSKKFAKKWSEKLDWFFKDKFLGEE